MKRKERIEKMEWFRSQMITEGHPHDYVFPVEFAGLLTFLRWYKEHMRYRKSLAENKETGM